MASFNARNGSNLDDGWIYDCYSNNEMYELDLEVGNSTRPSNNAVEVASTCANEEMEFSNNLEDSSTSADDDSEDVFSKNLEDLGIMGEEFSAITSSKNAVIRKKILQILKHQFSEPKAAKSEPHLMEVYDGTPSGALDRVDQGPISQKYRPVSSSRKLLFSGEEYANLKSKEKEGQPQSYAPAVTEKAVDVSQNVSGKTSKLSSITRVLFSNQKQATSSNQATRRTANYGSAIASDLKSQKDEISKSEFKNLLNSRLSATLVTERNRESRLENEADESNASANSKRDSIKKREKNLSLFNKYRLPTSPYSGGIVAGNNEAEVVIVNPLYQEIVSWPNRTIKTRQWASYDVDSIPEKVRSLIDVSILAMGFNIEFNSCQECIKTITTERGVIKSKEDENRVYWDDLITVEYLKSDEDFEVKLDHVDEYKTYYSDYLYNIDHSNYIAYNEENDVYYVISVEDMPKYKNSMVRVLLRSSKEDHKRLLVDSSNSIIENVRTKQIFRQIPDLESLKFTKVKNQMMKSELKDVEGKQAQLGTKYKFGVIYVKSNQSEDEIFANIDPGEDFEEFLDFLGDRISLMGWSHYRGGLDTNGSTGENSIYTQIEGIEIMFHVCTLLPFQSTDLQQLERKRHIGNDIVIFVFLERDCEPYLATKITSQFVHVHFVFQKITEESDTGTKYLFSVVSKNDVDRHVPFLSDYVVNKDEKFREFMLIKAINAERTALLSPAFKSRIGKSRKIFLKSLHDTYVKKKK